MEAKKPETCSHLDLRFVEPGRVHCTDCRTEWPLTATEHLLFQVLQRLGWRVDNLDSEMERLTHTPDPRSLV